MKLQKTSRLLAALSLTGALALSSLALPSLAQSKMMDSKMTPKMSSGKMSGNKMSSSKMGGKMMMSDTAMCKMCKLTPMETKTYMGMSKAEKALFRNHMDMMGMKMGGKMSGGKMSGKM